MSAEMQQLSLFKPEEEAELYHNSKRFGFFSLLSRPSDGGRFVQESYSLSLMPYVLENLNLKRDIFISQAEFARPNRRVVNLERLPLNFVDLDTYNMEFSRGRTPEQLANAVLFFCADEGIPEPSILIFSGRGVQAKWFLDNPLPRYAVPRWNAVQSELVERLLPVGADAKARDASRVLRLVQSVNSKSGEVVRVIHVASGADGLPLRYCFDDLADAVLPLTRQQLQAKREERQKLKQLKLITKPNESLVKKIRRGINNRQLSWHRLEDLRRLSELRGGVQEGFRQTALFYQLNFLIGSGAVLSIDLFREAQQLAKQIDPYWFEWKGALSSLYDRAKRNEAGEKIQFNGRKYPALYCPRNATLIDLFKITASEQQQLKTIISKDEKNARLTRKRRESGVVERSEYLDQVREKRRLVQSLKAEGMKAKDIAVKINIPIRTVYSYLN